MFTCAGALKGCGWIIIGDEESSAYWLSLTIASGHKLHVTVSSFRSKSLSSNKLLNY